MTKIDIIDDLIQKHQSLYEWLKKHPDEKWTKGPKDKWNTGEHIVHLIQSEKALNKALWLPKFYLKYKFGVNNRENRTYAQIVQKYQDKLTAHSGLGGIEMKMVMSGLFCNAYSIHSLNPAVGSSGKLPAVIPK